MDFIKGFDRNQLQVLAFDQLVAPDSWARIVELFVDILPLKELGFKHSFEKEGRPPFDSSDLLKVYFYAYRNGI